MVRGREQGGFGQDIACRSPLQDSLSSAPIGTNKTDRAVENFIQSDCFAAEWNKALPASSFRSAAAARTFGEIHSAVTAIRPVWVTRQGLTHMILIIGRHAVRD